MAASWTPTNSIKSSIGSAKPGFLQHGLFSQSSNLPGFFVKRRSFGVHATAATEKSLYDFTVKDIDGKDVPLSKFKGFEILAFPCNQFGGQEPGSNPEIKEFACTRFKAEFPIFDKVDVNGPNTAPVYQFLKSSAGGFLGDLVKWNFEKFLVDKNGKVIERYPPTTSPFQIEKDIQKLVVA
ncbi:putative glutathione peroxidase 7 [Citrus sinensis]|uniref:Glutathione peroxidase 7 n=1 Tax=Citrus sinensis TaxID=2711 RepID=A0ACB8NKW1_CITSI|nr:putative glutathione peroxidase 7 [Citrus sinensis]KAH9798749.1 putative glutathione peroxidase 7 [Citrus sinensis]